MPSKQLLYTTPKPNFIFYEILEQGFSNCGTHTTSGTPATVQWYTGTVRRHRWIKNKKKNLSSNAVT
jgi:hypothetical protein